jgi:threonine dehydratase
MAEITLADIQNAAKRIAPFVHRTPVLSSRRFNQAAGADCFFKCENFQRGGAFKMRGAANFALSLSEAERARGVVTFSSGNHGQAVAIAASDLNIPATIVMPADAPKSKLEATRSHGARIVLYDRRTENREEIGYRIAAESGAVVLPPYDHPWTIAGQGTAVLELLDDIPDLDAICSPVGGGGLLAGSSIAAKSINPEIKVFGAEPEIANDWALSLRAGHQVEIPQPETIADGLRTLKPGDVTFPVVQKFVDDILLVSEEEIKATVRFLLTRLKILVEPSGAVAAAAAFHRKLPSSIKRVGILISGGNVDLEALASICECK